MSENISTINIGAIKLLFGRGAIKKIPDLLSEIRVEKPLVITDGVLMETGLSAYVTQPIQQSNRPFAMFSDVAVDPGSLIVDKALEVFRAEQCDGVIGFGGGSTMDVAKCVAAMAVNPGRLLDYDHSNAHFCNFSVRCIPLINIPTTAGTGSELSPYAVITNEQQHRKATIGSPMLLSHVALVDPLVTVGLPPRATAACGADALAHCVEAFTSTKSANAQNPIIDALALRAIDYLYHYLPRAWKNGSDIEAREKVMWASTIGGIVLQYGSGAAHGLGNVLGGRCHVPHGSAIGMLLPKVLRFNLDVCSERLAVIAPYVDAAGADSAVDHLAAMLEAMQFPKLSDYLDDAQEIAALADLALADKCTQLNGKKVSAADAAEIYRKIY